MEQKFLPLCREDMEARGWDQADFVYVIGDAYVDHPSFGHAIISRLLESRGYRVAILSQPDWKDDKSITVYGEPRLGFLVSAGNMDSMVNHYAVSGKRRAADAYTPGGVMGKRPDYAAVVYGNLIRRTYKHTPVILGGIEASLRRLAHYDYWSDRLKRSILLDSGADMISYGMGERSILEIAEALEAGISIQDLTYIEGTVVRTRSLDSVYDALVLPSFEAMQKDKTEYARSFYTQYCNTDPFSGKRLAEPYPGQIYVVQNPPAKPLTQMEMDDVYELPYRYTFHPSYQAKGGVPAIEEVRFSLTGSRGCFGGCSFCALTFHQGRIVQSRSKGSLLSEAKRMTKEQDFKGYIHDVGGPTANFRHPSCGKQKDSGVCPKKQCLFPKPCGNLRADHREYVDILRALRQLPGVKKVFIRSGIRFDYLLADSDPAFLRELCLHHVSGQLKVAPEHVSDAVLELMGKPKNQVYRQFVKEFAKMNRRLEKDQYLVPYLMSSHPGSSWKEAVELAEYCRDMGYMPEQVQDFYPTPSTLSTCMYYTGLDPRTMKPVYVPKNPHEKAMQRALIQYRNPANYDLVKEALLKAGRTDLIGFEKHCLIRPRKLSGEKTSVQRSPGNSKDKKRTDRKNIGRKTDDRRSTGRNGSGRKTDDRKSAGRNGSGSQTNARRSTDRNNAGQKYSRKKDSEKRTAKRRT
ncbi:MAG: YgiQ family radical SAM protein [Ruminococcus sp.]|uniref:YgiQ family radical SAM protein n=1 Tax=Schaedlerella arabinosiphila TaxID=2044587 RepID=A0A426DGN3_9FIRM|nr:YgiQ family radical SAM protein [Schaedlerella arabinosiphila]MCI8723384.1 YgiQ family radical SAM protein [Ruminococcus sp.]RRK31916.1 YgiQ family radical SAM protein [Schaedlerella arabinosiphila]